MACQTYLTKRNGIYYCRIAIPAQYRNKIGKREHWQSLGTRSYQEAIVEVRQVSAGLFALMEDKQRVRKLRSEDIPIIAEQHYKHMMIAHETQNALVRPALAKETWVNEMDADFIAKNNQKIRDFELALSNGDYKAGEKFVADRCGGRGQAWHSSRRHFWG